MIKTYVAGIVRHALTTGGGILAGAGYIAQDDISTIAGLAPVLVGLGWSLYQKWSSK